MTTLSVRHCERSEAISIRGGSMSAKSALALAALLRRQLCRTPLLPISSDPFTGTAAPYHAKHAHSFPVSLSGARAGRVHRVSDVLHAPVRRIVERLQRYLGGNALAGDLHVVATRRDESGVRRTAGVCDVAH